MSQFFPSQWDTDLAQIISAATAVAVFYIGIKFVKLLLSDEHAPIRDSSKTHNWKSGNIHDVACYCNICKQLMVDGERLYCDCCGICCDSACTGIANKTLSCKAITLTKDEPMKHHWIKGNLSPSSVCEVCDEDCCRPNGLKDYRCCWCLRTVHSSCKPNLAEVCDFGVYRSLIIPPTSVEVTRKRSSVRKRYILKSLKPTGWTDWSPLIVIANCKSGSNDGEEILSLFRGILNPGQVIDLSSKRPEAALEWCALLDPVPCRILVAGGDGTVGWILNTILKLNFQAQPAVGILPLGTGNDLSRILGWGKGTSSKIKPTEILDAILEAEPVSFDRWKVDIKPYRSLRIKSNMKELFMYNYLSIGVDAQVTLDFHRTRESPFYIFSSRLFNKMLYLGYGTQQMIEKKCQGLNEKIELYLDGKKVELPAIESIVILNIDSWGAGVHLWEMGVTEGEESLQSYSDGKLEVLAIYSSLHIAQLQVGLSAPYRVGQAHRVQVKLFSPTAVQVDGEPWFQHPAEFQISHFNQTLMLKGNIPS